MGAVTSQALKLAIAQMAAWRAAGLEVPVAVNVSAQDVLGDHLVDEVALLLDAYGVPATSLKLELTESMLMADPHRAQQVLHTLSETGVRIAIDDFGTGYSSLAYLARLRIDELKIDRSFISRLHEKDSAVIVSSTIDLARRLGLRVVAEGVEDVTMLAFLLENRCDVAQGYHFSRPLPAPAFDRWAREHERRPAPLESAPAWTADVSEVGAGAADQPPASTARAASRPSLTA
jgi:EAL domain-containing protein (putative c-di-GMP-specific phosphodiesterase class I)